MNNKDMDELVYELHSDKPSIKDKIYLITIVVIIILMLIGLYCLPDAPEHINQFTRSLGGMG